MKKTISTLFYVFVILFLVTEIILRFIPNLKTHTEQNFNYYVNPYDASNYSTIYTFEPEDTLHFSCAEYAYSYPINELGLNYEKSPIVSESDTVVLGDSFTFGIGAKNDSDVVTLLGSNYINAGMPGSDPFFEYKLTSELFIPQGYKNFIFILNPSDLYDFVIRGGEERFQNPLTFNDAPWHEPFYHYSYTFRAFLHGMLDYDYSLLSSEKVRNRKISAVSNYTDLFQEINQKIESVEGTLTIFVHPYPATFSKENERLKEVLNISYYHEMCAELAKEGIDIYNLENDFANVLNSENYLEYAWEVDGHFNHKGYLLFSSIIKQKIQ